MICQCISDTPHLYYRGVGKCELSSLNCFLNSRFTRPDAYQTSLPTCMTKVFNSTSKNELLIVPITCRTLIFQLLRSFLALLFFLTFHLWPRVNPVGPMGRGSPSHCHHSVPGHPLFSSGLPQGLLVDFSTVSSPTFSLVSRQQPGWHCWNLESTQNPPGTSYFTHSESLTVPWSCQALSLQGSTLALSSTWKVSSPNLCRTTFSISFKSLLKNHFLISFSIPSPATLYKIARQISWHLQSPFPVLRSS